jgi:hypothetical protein
MFARPTMKSTGTDQKKMNRNMRIDAISPRYDVLRLADVQIVPQYRTRRWSRAHTSRKSSHHMESKVIKPTVV